MCIPTCFLFKPPAPDTTFDLQLSEAERLLAITIYNSANFLPFCFMIVSIYFVSIPKNFNTSSIIISEGDVLESSIKLYNKAP